MKAKTEQARAELYAILKAANFDVNQPEVWLAHASIRYTYCLQEDVKELEAALSEALAIADEMAETHDSTGDSTIHRLNELHNRLFRQQQTDEQP